MLFRFIFFVLTVVFVGCGHNPYFVSESGVRAKQCSFPVFFAIDPSVPDEYKQVIIQGFQYWNGIVRDNAYFYIGEFDQFVVEESWKVVPDIVAVSAPEEYAERGCAISLFCHNVDSGCIFEARVVINKSCVRRHNLKWVETLIRHEAGHLLGLNHNKKEDSLLNPQINASPDHPLFASEQEIKWIKDLYKKNEP